MKSDGDVPDRLSIAVPSENGTSTLQLTLRVLVGKRHSAADSVKAVAPTGTAG